MKICLDGMNLALPKGTGIATYARTLAHALAGKGHDVGLLYGQDLLPLAGMSPAGSFSQSLELELKAPRPRPHEREWWSETWHHVFGHVAEAIPLEPALSARLPSCGALYNIASLFRAAHGFFRSTGRFVKIRLPAPVDVMHWTCPVPVRAVGTRNVYTLHDLVPLLHPEMTLDRTGLYRKMLDRLVGHADAICTVSETSRQDIRQFFPQIADRVFNTYQAHDVSGAISSLSRETISGIMQEMIKERPGDYYIHYGQIEPKKNTGRILQAFLASGIRRKLVLVGSTGWKNDNALALLEQGQALGRVVHIPYVPDKTLFSLLKGARALFFPSLVEGFGLPVLEAFSLGTPVLTSGHGALAEIAGDAALLVDPRNSQQIRHAMEQLDTDDALCQRLSRAGTCRQAFFSLPAYQARLGRFYDMALSGRGDAGAGPIFRSPEL